jgi:hypothetical protein
MSDREDPLREEMLLARCLAGEAAAWQTLFQRHHGKLLGTVSRMVGPDLAEDVAGNVWCALLGGIARPCAASTRSGAPWARSCSGWPGARSAASSAAPCGRYRPWSLPRDPRTTELCPPTGAWSGTSSCRSSLPRSAGSWKCFCSEPATSPRRAIPRPASASSRSASSPSCARSCAGSNPRVPPTAIPQKNQKNLDGAVTKGPPGARYCMEVHDEHGQGDRVTRHPPASEVPSSIHPSHCASWPCSYP